MTRFFAFILPLCLLSPALAEPPVAKAPGDTKMQALGTVNGQALACCSAPVRRFDAERICLPTR